MGKFANDLLKILQFDTLKYLHLHYDLMIICSTSYICQYARNLHVYIMTYVMYKIVIVWIYDDTDPTEEKNCFTENKRIFKISIGVVINNYEPKIITFLKCV